MKLNSQSTQCWRIKLKKNQFKKRIQKIPDSVCFNPPNPWPSLWDWDNPIKNKPKKDLSQLGLTCQAYDSGHGTMITLYKVNRTNYKTRFLINLLVNDEIEKNINIKNEHNKTT